MDNKKLRKVLYLCLFFVFLIIFIYYQQPQYKLSFNNLNNIVNNYDKIIYDNNQSQLPPQHHHIQQQQQQEYINLNDNNNNNNNNVNKNDNIILNINKKEHFNYKNKNNNYLLNNNNNKSKYNQNIYIINNNRNRIKKRERPNEYNTNGIFLQEDLDKDSLLFVKKYVQEEYIIEKPFMRGRYVSTILPEDVNHDSFYYTDLSMARSNNTMWKLDKSLNPLLLPQPFIAIHIPKTGGTSLIETFKSNLNRVFFKTTQPTRKQAESFVKLGYEALFGHFYYGLHYFYDKSTKVMKRNENQLNPYSYMTFLRDPVDRVISHYYFLINHKEHVLHKEAAKYELLEWVNYSIIAKNEQCRRIIGMARSDNPPPDFLEQCIDRLKYSFKFIGLTEKFNESLVLLSFKTGFQNIQFISKNVGSRKSVSNIQKEVINRIKELNQIDIQAYEVAKDIFNKEIDLIGSEFFNAHLNMLLNNTS